MGEIHKEWTAAGVSASRTTTHRRMQDMGFRVHVKPLLNNRQRQKRLAWAKDKKGLDCCWVSKLCSLMKVNFAFPLEIRVPESGGRGEAQNPRCLRSSVKFPQSVMVWGCHVICWCWSTVFLRSKVKTAVYQEVLEHFMLPAADQLYGNADFIFQQDLAPATVPKLPVLG